MHNHKTKRLFLQNVNRLLSFLPSLFWILLVFGFDESPVAWVTIASALIHEIGHAIQIMLKSNAKIHLRTTLCGFRMKGSRHTSYLSDTLVYFGGPMFNFIAAVLTCFLPFNNLKIKQLFTVVNIATAVSNLLPIKGYDGYGIIYSLAFHFGIDHKILPILDFISFQLLVILTFVSFYIVTRIGSSYWMAGLFAVSLIREINEHLKNGFFEI